MKETETASLQAAEANGSSEAAAHRKITQILPERGWFRFDFQELWEARELIVRFVHRDFISSYKQTILGPLWFILPPVATTLIFTVVFGNIAKIPTDGAPKFLFFMMGVTLWGYFASCITRTSNTFFGNAGLFGKVYIPRLSVPLSLIISNLLTFSIQMTMFAAFYVYFAWNGSPIHPNIWLAALPLIIVQLAVLGLGIGCLVSAFTTYYRDLNMILGFGVQLWMYASCVINPLSSIPKQWQWLAILNPLVPVIETMRYAFFGTGDPYPQYLLISAAMTVVIFVVGLVAFKRMENSFMDTV